MSETFVIGLDFGSESARGTLIEASTGRQAAYHVHAYRHGIMTEALPGGRRLPAASRCRQPRIISRRPRSS
jgi:L-ribulokinase